MSAARARAKSRSSAGSRTGYLADSERPWASLIFLLPMVLAYELYVAGVFAAHPTASAATAPPPRITACILIQELFALFGAAGQHLPALALAGMLISAHLVRRDSWKVRPAVLLGMVVESAAWAGPLFVLGWAIVRLLPLARSGVGGNLFFLSLGAGVYEEMLFRLIVVTVLICIFRDGFRWRPGVAASAAIVTSAIAFSFYHYLGTGEPFLVAPLIFRTLAGAYLGSIYALRGFGVTAGSHAAYDLFIAALF
jgi:hypothetical protein